MFRVTNALKRRWTAALMTGGMVCSLGGVFFDPGCYASSGEAAWSDGGWGDGGPSTLGYTGGDGYGDSGYYGDGVGDNWSYSGIGGHAGSDGETFYFLDGDTSYISGP